MRMAILVTGLLSAAALACACAADPAVAAKPPAPVKIHAVAPAPIPGGLRYSATIEPVEQVSLAFRASGYVDELLRRRGVDGRLRPVQPGDRVSKGTVLAHMRDAEARERMAQVRARLEEAGASQTKTRRDLERATALFASDSLIRPDLDAAQAGFDAAQARTTAVRADLELAQIALDDCLLVAPAGGTVLERRVEAGTLASPGTIAFVLADLSGVKARFGIPDNMIQSVIPGQTIDIVVEAIAPATFAGRVTAIAPAADPQSRVFDVEVTIPNADGRLRPGMIGTVALTRPQADAHASSTLTIPLAAVIKSDPGEGRYAVLVVEPHDGADVARRRTVELGEVTGNSVVVAGGLKAGERVVVTGATLLVDGQQVRVLSSQ